MIEWIIKWIFRSYAAIGEKARLIIPIPVRIVITSIPIGIVGISVIPPGTVPAESDRKAYIRSSIIGVIRSIIKIIIIRFNVCISIGVSFVISAALVFDIGR